MMQPSSQAHLPATPESGRRARAFDAWMHGLRRDAVAWLSIMAWLSAYRCFIAWPDIRSVAPVEALRALATGARFDSVIATIVILPTVVVGGLAWLAGRPLNTQPLRTLLLWIFFIATALVYAGNYQFYRIMGTQIDQRVLALANDGDGAVRSTIWQAHHPLLFLAIALVTGAAAALGTLFLVRRTRQAAPAGLRNGFAQGLLALAVGALIFGLVRGFAWGETPIRVRNAYVSPSAELNRLIPSPYAFWLHAMEDLTADRSAPDAAQLAQALDVQDEALGRPPGQGLDIARRLARQAPGAVDPPRHIFLILLEGQHGFPLLDRYRPWGFYPGLAGLADEGAWFDHVLPSGRQTDNTLGALVAGTLSPGFVILTETGGQRQLATSAAPQFAKLGYDTHFFYGGYPGWERLDEFVLPQGFRHLHSAGEMPGKPGNAWGVWDGYLFDDVLSHIDPATPSFSLILTTNNHSPFDVDPSLLPDLPPLPPEAKDWDADTLRGLRHEMYVDREVTRFVREASRRFPHALFVITGDHASYGVNYVLPGGTALDPLTVPIIFTGDALPAAMRGRHARPASHLDIVPTLYALSAPAGFTYVAFGENLLAPGGGSHALGQDKVLLDGWLASTTDDGVVALGQQGAPPAADIALARRHHDAVRAISRAMIFAPEATAGN
ncbi:MAG: LTA synthase family protein [Hyphomicrobiales bacterium]